MSNASTEAFIRNCHMKLLFASIAALLLLTVADKAVPDAEEPVPTMSIMDLMVTVITPATDTLWGIEDPQTDEEWQVFIDAANVVIEAGKTVKAGGTGPNDNEWASDPAWDAFADVLIGAGMDALEAARKQDVDAMFDAGGVLYPPCEECHIQFNPGVQ
jgi:cytochrome c556